jgi:hypothetical protein
MIHWLLVLAVLKIIFSPLIFFMMKRIIKVHRDKNDYVVGNPQIIANHWGALIELTIFSLALLSLLIENHLTNFSLILAAPISISLGLFLKNLSIKIGTEINKGHYLYDKLNLTKMEFIMRFAVRFAASRIEAKTIKVAANMDYV